MRLKRLALLATATFVPLPAWAQSATVMTFQDDSAVPMLPTGPRPLARSLTGTPAVEVGEILPTALQSCPSGPPPPRRLLPGPSASRTALWPAVSLAACRHNLPTGLLDSLILVESGYRLKAVSRAGAAGLTQIMPATAIQLGLVDRFDPIANIEVGARYLRLLLDRFGGDTRLALAAYNAGPGAVARASGVPLNRETPDYVTRVLDFWRGRVGTDDHPHRSAWQLAVTLGFAPTRSGR